MYVVAALYQFASLPDYAVLRAPLQRLCEENQIRGTLLLAAEGINGTVAGSREAIDALVVFLQAEGRFTHLELKESYAAKCPFFRMKVRLKKEIVTLGVAEIDPTKQVGTYVAPQDWNALISQPDVVVIDTRNDYEVQIGAFKNAINPQTKTFREFPEFVAKNCDPAKQKRVAMYCTGGIRCEKASAYMLSQGFAEVYHLKGGILKYLEEVPPEQSLWKGECFVFDQRTAVKHGVAEGDCVSCYGCRAPLLPEDLNWPHYEPGVSCHHCYEDLSPERKASLRERQKQIELAALRGSEHLGAIGFY